MLVTVPVHDTRSLDDYAEHAGPEAVERLREAAAPLAGARVVNISSTAFGGGVAELLPTQIAILRDLEIDAEWRLIEGSEEFFSVTKLVHNALQGAGVPWTEAMEDIYLERLVANAARFEGDADYVIVHDPQPLGLLPLVEEAGKRRGRWVWRCHIDLSHPMETVWGFFSAYAGTYDATVFTLDEFVRDGAGDNVNIIPPSIDPLSPKNAYLDDEAVLEILTSYGIDPGRPIVT
ncbi:MAG TPA: glycosyl transferase family 1, partial [Actinomycetota bacterium]|nr:glycosyl transferase family 1 [Actinomycetota bacterium]